MRRPSMTVEMDRQHLVPQCSASLVATQLGRLAVVVAIVIGLCVLAPAAGAVPAATGPTFTLSQMGTDGPLAFYGEQGSAELTFPVPPGLVPDALNATVEIPVKVRGGLITVSQKERTIARVPLPSTDQAKMAIPLAGASVDDNAVTVTLRTSLIPEEGYCLDPISPLRLVNGAIVFGGSEAAPSVVAEFLPPILRKLTIAIPTAPSRAESEAAVRLATSVTAHYGQQPTAIAVVPLSPSLPPAGPFERQILIRQGPDTGVALQATTGGLPNLKISGSDGDLTNQTRLLASDVARLALSSRAVVGPLRSAPQLPGDVTTLQALGQRSVSAVALAPQVSVGIDQTRMGRPAKSVRVHLKGSFTPPPSSVSARLVALVGGETVDTWQVDDKGLIDRWVDLPDHLLQRYTTLGIALNIAGNTGRCGEFQPLTLTIDGDSVVQSEKAAPPVPDGLQSLPQSLMPRTLVGIGPDAFADTVRAAAITVAMQRLSALPIDTAITGVDDALASHQPAIIVAADGWQHPGVELPISADQRTLNIKADVADGEPTTLTLDPDLGYGSLQVFIDGGRSLLVATSNAAPAQLDALLRWMTADPRRFSALDGAAVVAAPGREPVVVGPQPGTEASATPAGTPRILWIAGLTVATALGGVLVALGARRRRGSTRGR